MLFTTKTYAYNNTTDMKIQKEVEQKHTKTLDTYKEVEHKHTKTIELQRGRTKTYKTI